MGEKKVVRDIRLNRSTGIKYSKRSYPYLHIIFFTPINNNNGFSHIIEHLLRRELNDVLFDKYAFNWNHKEVTFPEYTLYSIEFRTMKRVKKMLECLFRVLLSSKYIENQDIFDKEIYSCDEMGNIYGRVYNEIQYRSKTDIYLIEKKILQTLVSSNPYKYDICGEIDKIKKTEKKELYKYYRAYYTESNMEIVCGNEALYKAAFQIYDTQNLDKKKFYGQENINREIERKSEIIPVSDYLHKEWCAVTYPIDGNNKKMILSQLSLIYMLMKKRHGNDIIIWCKTNKIAEYIDILFRETISDPHWTFVLYGISVPIENVEKSLRNFVTELVFENYHELQEIVKEKIYSGRHFVNSAEDSILYSHDAVDSGCLEKILSMKKEEFFQRIKEVWDISFVFFEKGI